MRRHGWVLLAMAIAATDLSGHLYRDWVPHDEGALALAASLVRSGIWPHEGYTDIYSGGLALLDAGAQLLFGDTIRALRIPLAVAAVGWVALLAACFRRFTTPPVAAGLALVGYLWGPPLYPSPIPSWYLLFLATAVVWCLFRWQETGMPRWWGAIGALIGVGIFIKINAIFLLAGAGIVLLVDARPGDGPPASDGAARLVGGPIAAIVLLGVLGACAVVQRGWGWSHAWSLALPLLVLGVAAAGRAWTASSAIGDRISALLPSLAWLIGGLSAILIPWISAYAVRGAVTPLVEGVLVLPFSRAEFAGMLPPTPHWMDLVTGAAFAAALWPARASRSMGRAIALAILSAAVWSVWRGRQNDAEVITTWWRVVRICGVTTLLLATTRWASARVPEGRALFAVASIATWFSLLQYPFAAPIYFAYVAPLLLLAGAAVARSLSTPRPVSAAVTVALSAWILGTGHGQPLNLLGWRFHPSLPYLLLSEPRGGIEVLGWEAAEYAGVFAVLDRWGARRIVAGPDTPEMYYLGERPFPDREFFEFMAPDWSAATFARRIAVHHPDAVVLNRRPGFSKVALDSVIPTLPTPWRGDTTIGRFRLILLPQTDASP